MNAKRYINEVADRTCLPRRYRKKIVKDLRQEFSDGFAKGQTEHEIIDRMGEPDVVAAGIYENYISISEDERPFVEYKSKKEIFGVPLVHIVKGKRRSAIRVGGSGNDELRSVPMARGIIAICRRAKGIITIGNLAYGVIAIGNISAGIVNICNIGVGLFSVGNLAFGLAIVFGNLALGALAAGNGVVGYGAVGNVSIGWYSMGNVAIGNSPLSVETFSQVTESVQNFIHTLPPVVDSFFGIAFNILSIWPWLFVAVGLLTSVGICVGQIVSRTMEK